MKVIKETTYKGTRILLGNEKRDLINKMIDILKDQGYQEIQLPIINFREYFESKVGEENNNLMFNFKDRGDRDLCLAPEYTAIIQQLANTTFKQEKDVKVFYIAECFRGEKPQKGRYRQFTQLGVEIINPTKDYELSALALDLLIKTSEYYIDLEVDLDSRRGLDYYKDGRGFEIHIPSLGSSSQICGGGEYEGGIGFALGIDRILDELNDE